MSQLEKKLVFDGQVFQTQAWHRGMGKYSLELIVALNTLNLQNKYWHTIELILSKKFKTEDSVYKALKERAPQIRIIELNLAKNEYDNRPVAERNRELIDNHFASSKSSIDYIILSLMQSEIAPAFSSLDKVHNFLLFYDLIPLMFHQTYLSDSMHQKSYLSKIAELLKADTYLAISKTVANDVTMILGIDKNRVISIDGAPIDHGHEEVPFEIQKPFILMPTGNDLRKNNRRGIEGFELFNKRYGNAYHLVVTSTFQEFEIEELKKISRNVVFTGNISGEELEYLYSNSTALLFPTEYEGLGLPILEAIEKNKPVACSDISVFKEISESAFEYFDPRDTKDIASALERSIKNQKLPLREYGRITNKFTWDRTARLFLEKCKKTQINKKLSIDSRPIYLFCPSTDESIHGGMIQRLYSEMSRESSVRYYMDTYGKKNKSGINYLVQIAGVVNIAQPTEIIFDEEPLPIYFIENTPNSAAILLAALAKPGILILHASDLNNLWNSAVKRKLVHPTRLEAEIELSSLYSFDGLLFSILANQQTIITTSKSFKNKIEKKFHNAGISKIPRIIYAPLPVSELVYGELKQDYSLLEYNVDEVSNSLSYTYNEYAKLLLTESIKLENN